MSLEAYYNFEQTSGSLLDQTANNNDSTTVSVTSRTATGVLGSNAYDFDGADDKITLTDFLDETSAFTLMAWVKPDDATTNKQVICTDTDNNSPRGIQFKLRSDGQIQFFHPDVGSTTYGSYSADSWLHITAAYDGASDLKFYSNGVNVAASSGSITTDSGHPVVLGARENQGSEWFDGTFDEVRIYSRALSRIEIAYLYNVGIYGDYVSSVKTQ